MKSDKTINVFIVDDHPFLIEGLEIIINNNSDTAICGSALSIQDAIKFLDENKPDVLIADLQLKEESGIDLIKKVKQLYPSIKTIIMSMHDEPYHVERSIQAGADGYIGKSESTIFLLEAIKKVDAGEQYLSPEIEKKMLNQVFHKNNKDVLLKRIEYLSLREQEVFHLMGKGKKSKDIANILHISVKTVESHKENIKKKLEISSMSEAIELAIKWSNYNQNV